MSTVRRRLFNVAAAVSLVLCVTVGVLWMRSCRGIPETDAVEFVAGGRLHHAWINPGVLVFGIEPVDEHTDWGTTRYHEHHGLIPGTAISDGVRNGKSYWRVGIDLWLVALLTALPVFGWAAIRCRKVIRSYCVAQGHCPSCGYDLRATPERCPECGAVAAGAKAAA